VAAFVRNRAVAAEPADNRAAAAVVDSRAVVDNPAAPVGSRVAAALVDNLAVAAVADN
jgi:hypothetical protein